MDKGDKVIWKGKEFTVFNTYMQPMVTLVDGDQQGRSYPLAQVIADVMRDARKEPKI